MNLAILSAWECGMFTAPVAMSNFSSRNGAEGAKGGFRPFWREPKFLSPLDTKSKEW